MAYTQVNSEDRLVQATFAEHLEITRKLRTARDLLLPRLMSGEITV